MSVSNSLGARFNPLYEKVLDSVDLNAALKTVLLLAALLVRHLGHKKLKTGADMS
jgi:hypothetical protein